MSLFNINIIKEIIDKYFNKNLISNYCHYDDSFYVMLAEILNNIYNIKYYNDICKNFLDYSDQINFTELSKDYLIFLEFENIILLMFKILEQINMIDYYNFTINDSTLLEELYNNNNFYFLKEITYKIKINNDINEITNKFENI